MRNLHPLRGVCSYAQVMPLFERETDRAAAQRVTACVTQIVCCVRWDKSPWVLRFPQLRNIVGTSSREHGGGG